MRFLVYLLVLPLAVGAATAQPVRLTADAFGTQAEIEIRDMEREAAVAAAHDALREIHEISLLADPSGTRPGGLGALNAAAGKDSLLLDPRAAELLRRGLQYCLWTNGAHGPLGGELYHLWNQEKMPIPSDLRDAVISAGCNQMSLTTDEAGISVKIANGSRVLALGMQLGFALDRAAEILKDAGITNAWLEIGWVYRAMGDGPEGKGWLASLPPAPGTHKPSDQVWLRDQSMAVAALDGPVIQLIDQRTGVPARGVVMVATVTELALDADALAATLFVAGLREGHMRLGGLNPRPSVYWLLGEGKGEPLESTYRWSELERIRRRH